MSPMSQYNHSGREISSRRDSLHLQMVWPQYLVLQPFEYAPKARTEDCLLLVSVNTLAASD